MRGAAWMVGTLLSFTTMALAVREVTPEIHTFQVMFSRTVIGFIILLPIVAWHRFKPLRTSRLRLHIGRNFVHFFGQLGWFYGITLLPLATVFALEFTKGLNLLQGLHSLSHDGQQKVVRHRHNRRRDGHVL